MTSIQLATATVKSHVYAVLIDPVADTAQVTSRSEPGRTHTVTADGCDCTYASFHGGQGCAHLAAVSAVQQERRAREKVTA